MCVEDRHTDTTAKEYTLRLKKVCQLMFDSNFGKCGPIFRMAHYYTVYIELCTAIRGKKRVTKSHNNFAWLSLHASDLKTYSCIFMSHAILDGRCQVT